MFCALLDHCSKGLWPELQWIEVRTTFQIPSVCLIGLPGPAVGEARERVRSAIEACGFKFPKRRVVINLSPADTKKHSTGVDLAIALSVLSPEQEHAVAAWGELGLNGEIKSVGQCARAIVAAADAEIPLLILPESDRTEVERIGPWVATNYPPVQRLRVAFASTVREAHDHAREPARGVAFSTLPQVLESVATEPRHHLPMSPGLIRVLMTSVVGRHHLLLLGPKGTGKSTAFEVAEQLLPEAPRSIRVRHRLMAELDDPHPAEIPHFSPPVRRLGSDVRPQALVGRLTGSGRLSRAGELMRAHGGVLVANEFLEWSRDSREILREPLESRRVQLNRAAGSISAPADFVFWASSNLCPCGEAETECRCPARVKNGYLGRLSGPILDRIDLSYVLQSHSGRRPVDLKKCRDQILQARGLLLTHYGSLSSEMPHTTIEALTPTSEAKSLRSRHAITKVAVTLAALDGQRTPTAGHFDEARMLRTEFLRNSDDPRHLE